MMMKRGREEEADKNMKSMANCLILLSNHGGAGPFESVVVESSASRVFECKTCNRQFTSFQALGGHRASHKKPRLIGSGELRSSPAKPKTHDCPVCGMEFAIGQALGGHMRRHRTDSVNENDQQPPPTSSPSPPRPLPIVKRSNSRRVFCLDLNLTPMENKFLLFGKTVTTIESCI